MLSHFSSIFKFRPISEMGRELEHQEVVSFFSHEVLPSPQVTPLCALYMLVLLGRGTSVNPMGSYVAGAMYRTASTFVFRERK